MQRIILEFARRMFPRFSARKTATGFTVMKNRACNHERVVRPPPSLRTMKFIIGLLVQPIIDADDLKLAPSSQIHPMLSLIERGHYREIARKRSSLSIHRLPDNACGISLSFRETLFFSFLLFPLLFRAKIRASDEQFKKRKIHLSAVNSLSASWNRFIAHLRQLVIDFPDRSVGNYQKFKFEYWNSPSSVKVSSLYHYCEYLSRVKWKINERWYISSIFSRSNSCDNFQFWYFPSSAKFIIEKYH